MNEQRTISLENRGTRRSLMRMGAIGAATIVATLGSAKADGGGENSQGDDENSQGDLENSQGGGHNCFLRGTTILTADGGRKIEDLVIGDLLPTMFGGTRPIQWIGRYPVKKSDPSKPWPKGACPVRIARSSLAPNVPEADLYVTQAHGVFIDDVLVSAGYLVNEMTITLCEARELNELEFFHIKLESHDVIYAERTPVETLLNVDESAVNFADYFRMYGVPIGNEVPCLPMLASWRPSGLKSRFRSALSWNDRRERIAAIRDRLEERAIALSPKLEPAL